MGALRRIGTAILDNGARTSRNAADPRLRGRTYAIPFDRVWSEAVALAGGGLSRWRLRGADDYEGVIRAEATAWLLRSTADLTIRVVLDGDAQTRVDAEVRNRSGRADLGASARHIARFFRALDAAVTRERRPAGSPAR